MKLIKNYTDDTKCVHAGMNEYEFGPVVPPIYQVSTFKFKDTEQGARLFKGEEDGYIYTRMRNPTIEALENAVSVLEGGAKALGCGSGMAAITSLIMTVVKAGDHVVCGKALYGPTTTFLSSILSNFGVDYTFVDSTNTDEVSAAMKTNTKLVFIETPGNPTLVISDIKAIADITHKYNAKLAVDNTFMSPVFQKPFELGADYIIHSMTKYLNGHADVVAGIIVLKDENEYPVFRRMLNHLGGTINPFDAFLVHRGIKTLKLRINKATENSLILAEFLENHPKVEWVMYPGLKSHPQHELAKKQMSGFGAMISCELKGGLEAGKILLNNIELWQLAVSLGGVESLIQHPASMTHASMGPEARKEADITDGLVRISVGIEDVDELIKGFEAGLNKI